MFFKAGVELAGGDSSAVHFAYRHLQKGAPQNLPADFKNIFAFDQFAASSEDNARLAAYVQQHGISLVHFFDMQPVAPIYADLRRAGAKVLLSYWGAPISSLMPPWKLLLKKLQYLTSDSKLDGLIFESAAMAKLATHGRGVPHSQIDIVPLGVDIRKFATTSSDYAFKKLDVPQTKKIIFYAGHMEERKGVHVLVKAAIELLTSRGRSDVCFLICGNREGESERFEAMYRGLNLESDIRFGGYRDDISKIYSSCLCGVVPSTGWDSFPRTAVEMAACGLPVLASRLHGLPESVLDGKTGLLFEPGNHLELADCIERLLDEPELAARLGSAGRKRCEEELNLERQYDKFLEVLKSRCRRLP